MIRKGFIKRAAAVICGLVMLTGLMGCSFSIGNSDKKSGDSGKYAEIFTDAASRQGSTYHYSMKSYKFTLDSGYGEMMVYVDTTNGHEFELVSDPAGFRINDKDGDTVLYAVCMDKDKYADYTAECTEVKTVNGRDFLYRYNSGDGSENYCSYMADCGLDCGLILEVHDGASDNFELVAFDGDEIFGSSSDVHYYQGKSVDEASEEETTENTEEMTEEVTTGKDSTETTEDPDDGSSTAGTNSISSEFQSALETLNTDYNKITWGSVYSIFEDYPGIIISVSPCFTYDGYGLLIAVTNLYDKPVTFSGSAKAKGGNDEILGDAFIYSDCIGPGSTIIEQIDCGESIPDGRIHWEDCNMEVSTDTYVPWEADYKAAGNISDGYISVDYSIYASDGTACTSDELFLILVDEEGFALYTITEYPGDIDKDQKVSGTANIYGESDILSKTKDVAMFTNTIAK